MTQEKQDLSRLTIDRKTGDEAFRQDGKDKDFSLGDFWRWSASDLVSNIIRGVLAEYLVACDLGIASNTREPWQSYDLEKNEIKIEVKSAAYVQSWTQEELSSILFNIRPTRAWNPDNNKLDPEVKRQADVYVFCLLAHQEKKDIQPLNLDQWEFYVMPTKQLRPDRKSISLKALLDLWKNPNSSKSPPDSPSLKFGEIWEGIEKITKNVC